MQRTALLDVKDGVRRDLSEQPYGQAVQNNSTMPQQTLAAQPQGIDRSNLDLKKQSYLQNSQQVSGGQTK